MDSCPQCRSENIKKVSLVFETQTQSIETLNLGVGIGTNTSGLLTGTTSGTLQTKLGQRIQPPQKTALTGYAFRKYALAVIVTLVLTYFAGQTDNPLIRTITPLLVGGIGLFLAKVVTEAKKLEVNEVYEHELVVWYNQWICMRCGEVFVLGTDDSKAESINS